MRIVVIDPKAAPFPDAAATGLVTYFHPRSRPETVELGRVDSIPKLAACREFHTVGRTRLAVASRWSQFARPPREKRTGFVELGELCRVHRGAVTGANRVWIAGSHSSGLPPAVLRRSVTRAREILDAGLALCDASHLKSVIALPADLDALASDERAAVERFLGHARAMGADAGYIAQHRRAWWSIDIRDPAPILATYMARRPPAFVRNLADACHLNIAHGIYPRETLSEQALLGLTRHLAETATVAEGRTYAGGLTKFEPREMERLLVPSPETLEDLGGADSTVEVASR